MFKGITQSDFKKVKKKIIDSMDKRVHTLEMKSVGDYQDLPEMITKIFPIQ